jgi:outer membrane lipoprotein-sorting protein
MHRRHQHHNNNMSKFLSAIAISTILVSLASHVHAQAPTAPPATTPTPSATPTATTPELKLLGKAIGLFWQGNRARTESQIVMTFQRKGTKTSPVQINASVKTISQTEDRFRSELTISRAGSPATITYSIVCDGQTVWMYRPDKRQYSQSTFAEFKPQPYSLLVGLSTVFFVSIPEPDRKAIISDLATGGDPFRSIPTAQLKNLQGNIRQVDGENLRVYTFDNPAEKSSFSGFVQPETGFLKQVEFVSNIADADIKIVEKISTHTTTTDPSTKPFKFSPPPGVKKVQSVATDLLQLLQ